MCRRAWLEQVCAANASPFLNFSPRPGVDTINLLEMCIMAGAHTKCSSFSPGLLGILLLAVCILAGCKMDPNEEFIQGQWYDNNDHLANLPGESRQESFWYFEDKIFEAYGCCFTPYDFSGNYLIVESEGDTLMLELYQLKGQNVSTVYKSSDTITIEIEIDRQADTIQIGSSDPHVRVMSVP